MGLFYSITVFLEDYNIVFRDSLKVINTSLGNLGKLFQDDNMIKGETPLYETVPENTPKEDILYIMRDIEILGRGVYRFFMEFNFKKFTNASETFKNFKKTVDFKKYFPTLSRKEDDFLRKSYKGGYVFAKKSIREKIYNEPITQYDINSMYPFILLDFPMPIGKPEIIQGKDFNEVFEKNFYYVCKVKMCVDLKPDFLPTLQTKDILVYSALGIRKSDYIESTNGDFYEFHLTNFDIELIEKHYNCEIYYEEIYKFHTKKGLFEKHILKFKALKEKAKKEGDKVTEMYAKIMLNSLYGKFGSKLISQRNIPYLDENLVLRFSKGEKEEVEPNYIPVAIFTTSLARKYLIEHAQLNYKNFLYCDTDSLHLFNRSKHIGFNIDKSKFGCWSIDGEYKKATYLRSKLYMCLQTDDTLIVKGAGITPELKQILNFDNFKIGATFGMDKNGNKIESECYKRQLKQVKGGPIIEKVPFTIKRNDYNF